MNDDVLEAGVTSLELITVKHGSSLQVFIRQPAGEVIPLESAMSSSTAGGETRWTSQLVELMRDQTPEGYRMWRMSMAHDDSPLVDGVAIVTLAGADLDLLGDVPLEIMKDLP